MSIKNTTFAFLLVLFSAPAFAQISTDTAMIKVLRTKLLESKEDWEKAMINDSLRDAVRHFLANDSSYQITLNIPYTGDLYAPDGAFRIVTWNLPLKDGTYNYFAYVQINPESNPVTPVTELIDRSADYPKPEFKSLRADKWYGALYYTILPFKHNKKPAYLVLGWDGNNPVTNKKLIETMYFDQKNRPRFGLPVLDTGERMPKKRIVFEYIKDGYMTLRYDDKLKMVVFNQIQPMKPEFEGIYAYYAPVLIYDGLKLKKGSWTLEEDISPQNGDNKIYNDPKKLKTRIKE